MAQQQALPLRTASPGEIIFSEGAMGNPLMYVIKEGSVEISITRGERKVVLSTLERGQFFGEMALLSTEPRSATAKALSYCEFQVRQCNFFSVNIPGRFHWDDELSLSG